MASTTTGTSPYAIRSNKLGGIDYSNGKTLFPVASSVGGGTIFSNGFVDKSLSPAASSKSWIPNAPIGQEQGSVKGAATGPSYNNLVDTQKQLSQEELKNNLLAYDRVNSQYGSQLEDAKRSRELSLSNLNNALNSFKTQVGQARTSAQDQFDRAVGEASDTANSIQKKNRNTLRALGILGSSAAGELLAKPYNEFDKQRADLNTQLNSRYKELDDLLVNKTNEHANLLSQLENNYSNLVGNIQKDMRFNDQERKNAITQANAALRNNIAQIRNQQFLYEQQVGAARNNLLSLGNNLSKYNMNTQAPSSYGYTDISSNPTYTSQTADIYNPYKRLHPLYAALDQMNNN